MTDLGGARSRLAALITGMTADIRSGLLRELSPSGADHAKSRDSRRGMIQRVSGLDAVIDQAAGEFATSPFRPDAAWAAADGLFAALAAWRSLANHLEVCAGADREAARVRDCLPPLLYLPEGFPGGWPGDRHAMRDAMLIAVRRLAALRTDTVPGQLLADRTADGILALRRAITGVRVLEHPRLAWAPRRLARPRVPDMLQTLINAVRAFLTIGAAALIWIWTAWPGGAKFIIFATIAITLFAPREDAAYIIARTFTIGTAFAAVVGFAVLPRQSGFAGFCVALGLVLVLVPAGAFSSRSWHQPLFVALTVNFIGLLRPSNFAVYDPGQFYNTAVAVLGSVGLAMLAMRLLPPMSPPMRARRLLALTLRDLRRLANGRLPGSPAGWQGRIYNRLCAIPVAIESLQAARMTVALTVGNEIVRLRRIAQRFAIGDVLEPAMTAVAAGDSRVAVRELARFDQALMKLSDAREMKPISRARGTVLSMSGSLARHAAWFDTRPRV